MELELDLDHPKKLAEAFTLSCLEQDVDPKDFVIAVAILYFDVRKNAPTFFEFIEDRILPELKVSK